ncbi:hypothetical protein DF286_03260 [Sphingosinicella humi]|uniref:Uncharacterized protein n=1 Tax=Allosphingosinicella humi TaxID=2068657 RepID=A0A2U2J0Y9_9SPHN|nr:hypothetical protein DF286_03260 [Sphingosinicella humi]
MKLLQHLCNREGAGGYRSMSSLNVLYRVLKARPGGLRKGKAEPQNKSRFCVHDKGANDKAGPFGPFDRKGERRLVDKKGPSKRALGLVRRRLRCARRRTQSI